MVPVLIILKYRPLHDGSRGSDDVLDQVLHADVPGEGGRGRDHHLPIVAVPTYHPDISYYRYSVALSIIAVPGQVRIDC